MVANNVGRDDLEKAVDGIRMTRLEVPQQSAAVGAELEISFLNEVFYQLKRNCTVSLNNTQNNSGDQRLEAPEKLKPSRFLPTTQAGIDEFLG